MNSIPPLYEKLRELNERDYSKREYYWGTKQATLARLLSKELPAKSTILDLGAGEGRNAVYLARQGHLVTAVDFAAQGMRKTENRAKKHKVSIDTVVANIADKDFIAQIGTFDAIIAQHVLHFLTPEDANLVLGYMKEKIKPGGYAAIAAFRGIAKNPNFKRFENFELSNAFEVDGWKIHYYLIDVHPGKDGTPKPIVEILAQKPKPVELPKSDVISDGPKPWDD